ncbi:regulatory protein [Oceanobacillus limi]|uniref:Regulatory protein RecX n=1 Tax=Oceanobacillus limi TaxID=930131 RepID=A0A1I0GJ31_9BACI|nr:recombination regulator RecX [Oceanobacillus limi]SET70948.1 regulatory protein [Oceanobacillus limi]
MKKISRITTQKKSKSRYNIYLVEGDRDTYGFSVDEAVLIEHNLRKGLELDEATMETLKRKDTLQKAYTLAVNFLSYRMRTIKEMNDYLVKKEVDEEHIDPIIDKLIKEGYLNDKEFAKAFVQTRLNTSHKGPQLVKRELIEKGVASGIATEAVGMYTYEQQFEKAEKWVEKKIRSSKKDSFKKQSQQLQSNLMQKGFTQDVIQDVLQSFQEAKDDHTEWDALVYQGEKLVRKHERKYSSFELKSKVKEGLYRKGFSMENIKRFVEEYVEDGRD